MPVSRRLDVQTDPHKCGFGVWYDGASRQQAEAFCPQLKPLLAAINEPHQRLHRSAVEIGKVYRAGDEAAIQAAEEIYRSQTEPALKDVQSLLTQINQAVAGRVMSDEAMLEKADTTTLHLVWVVACAAVLGIVLAIAIARGMVRPIRRCQKSIDALASQDFSQRPVVDRKDELGQMAESLEPIAFRPRKRPSDTAGLCVQSMNNLPTPVVSIDREFNVMSMNAAGAAVVGLTSEKCVGRKCYDLFKTSHCRTPECRCAQAMGKNGVFTGETIADPSGMALPIRYTAAPIKKRRRRNHRCRRVRAGYHRNQEGDAGGPRGGRQHQQHPHADHDGRPGNECDVHESGRRRSARYDPGRMRRAGSATICSRLPTAEPPNVAAPRPWKRTGHSPARPSPTPAG